MTTPAGLAPAAATALRTAREIRGWKPWEVAHELRCTTRFVQMVEAGSRVPSPRTLELWLRVLDVDAETRAVLHDLREVTARP